MERPLLLPLLSVIAGLSLAPFYSCPISNTAVALLLICAFAGMFVRSRIPFMLSLCVLLFIWGDQVLLQYLHPEFTPNHITNHLVENPRTIEGVIDSRVESTEKGCRLYVRSEKICEKGGYTEVSGRILVFVGEGRTRFLSGDRVRFSSRLSRPRNYGLPGEYDYARHLALREVFATAYVKNQDDVQLIRRGVDLSLKRSFDRIASVIGDSIDSSVPPLEGAVLRALLLGEQGGVPRALNDAYARCGVNHILSISGFHVGIITLVLFQLLFHAAARSRFLLLHCNLRRFILLVTLPVMVFYLFLTGTAPATVRSVIMLAAFIVGLSVERETDPLDLLILAAIVILALTPAALYEISFQLSFLALWGLLVLTPMFMTPFRSLHEGILRRMMLFLMASAAATTVTMLPVAFYFYRVSLTGLLANFVIVPLMGYGAVIAGFAALPFVWLVPQVAGWLFSFAALLVWMSNAVIERFSAIPVMTFLHPGRTELLLFYLFLLSITFLKEIRIKIACCSAIAVIFLVLLFPGANSGAGKLTIDFLSVGQGESILVTFPGGERMLVDGGGNPASASIKDGRRNVGERLLAPALWSLGVRRIDYLVLSHPHPDHMQGLLFIAANFDIGEFWEGHCRGEGDDYLELKRILAERKVPVHIISAADGQVRIGEAGIEALLPVTDRFSGRYGSDDANNQSLVLRLVFGRFSVLFTGDIGFAAEERLLKNPEKLRCTVLKVPHHGSRYSGSEAFLDAAAPEAAVISAGYRNIFRLPSDETLKRFYRRQIRPWRTDLHGTIRVIVDGEKGSWDIRPFQGQIN